MLLDRAEEKVHSQLGRYDLIKKDKPNTIIGVLGCMAQNLKHDLLETRPYVDIILGPDSYRKLPELLNRSAGLKNSIVDTTLSRYEVYDDLLLDGIESPDHIECYFFKFELPRFCH